MVNLALILPLAGIALLSVVVLDANKSFSTSLHLSNRRLANEATYNSPEVIESEDGELHAVLTIGEAMFSSGDLLQKVVGYNGNLGGPTLRAKPGDTLYITLLNKLPVEPCDTDVPELWNQFHGADTTNLHFHGLHVSEAENPNNLRIESGGSYDYVIKIPESHQGGTHWYHPHSAGSNAMHVAGGAAGFLIIDDLEGDLPSEVADLPEVLLRIQFLDFAALQNDVVNGTMGRSYMEQCREHCLPVEAREDCSEYFFLGGPEKGEYSPDGILAVNGYEEPTIELVARQWYRFRTLFVPLGSETIEPSLSSYEACEFKLLAKDGMYIPLAPRDIKSGYMTTGSRADFLIKCDEIGTYEFRSLADARNQQDRDGNFTKGSLDRLIALLEVVESDTSTAITRNTGILPSFRVSQPCYAADLQDIEPDHKSYILQSGRTPDLPLGVEFPEARSENVSFFAIAAGPNGTDMPLSIQYAGPEQPDNFTFNLKLGDIWEIDYFVPQTHPWHTHVDPFEIVSLPMMDTHNDYFQVGDRHDVLMVPIGGNETEDYGKAVLKMHLATHSGMLMAHCHDYTHIDKGMAIVANIATEGTPKSPKVSGCYSGLEDRGYLEIEGGDSSSNDPSVDNTGSNASTFVFTSAWGISFFVGMALLVF